MKYVLLLPAFCLAFSGVKAQAGSGRVFAAPGMSVKLQPGLPQPVPRKRVSPAPKPQVVRPAVNSPVLPRFWHATTDTARSSGAHQVYRFAASTTLYPPSTIRAGIDGLMYVRLTIAADGTVSQAIITRRALNDSGGDDAYFKQARADLDAEVLRTMRGLRFKPSKADGDTVTLTQRFVVQ